MKPVTDELIKNIETWKKRIKSIEQGNEEQLMKNSYQHMVGLAQEKLEGRLDVYESWKYNLEEWRTKLQDWYGSEWKKHDDIFENQIKTIEKQIEKIREIIK